MKPLMTRYMAILLGLFLWASPVHAASIGIVSNDKVAAMTTMVEAFKGVLQSSLDKVVFSSLPANSDEAISDSSLDSFDLIFVTSGDSIKIIVPRTQKPVVFSIIFDPNIRPLGVSGKNMAGISLNVSPEQQIAAIKEILPSVKTVGIFYSHGMEHFIAKVKPVFDRAGLVLRAVSVDNTNEMPQALDSIKNSVDLFWLIPDPSLYNLESIQYILKSCADNHIPVMGFGANVTKAGALFSCAYDFEDAGRQAGDIALRILKGESPDTIGIVSPRRINYSFNKRIKEYLGISIAPTVWHKAQDIF